MTKATRIHSDEQRQEAKSMAATDAHPYCAPMCLNAIVTLALYATIGTTLLFAGFLGSLLVNGMGIIHEGGETVLDVLLFTSSLWLIYLLARAIYMMHRTKKHLAAMEPEGPATEE